MLCACPALLHTASYVKREPLAKSFLKAISDQSEQQSRNMQVWRNHTSPKSLHKNHLVGITLLEGLNHLVGADQY